jgi:hypothetical protein
MEKIITSMGNQTSSPASLSRRLTPRETAAVIGGNLGDLVMFRYGGPKYRDPTFPVMVKQTYDEAEVLAWKQARDAKTKLQENS